MLLEVFALAELLVRLVPAVAVLVLMLVLELVEPAVLPPVLRGLLQAFRQAFRLAAVSFPVLLEQACLFLVFLEAAWQACLLVAAELAGPLLLAWEPGRQDFANPVEAEEVELLLVSEVVAGHLPALVRRLPRVHQVH